LLGGAAALQRVDDNFRVCGCALHCQMAHAPVELIRDSNVKRSAGPIRSFCVVHWVCLHHAERFAWRDLQAHKWTIRMSGSVWTISFCDARARHAKSSALARVGAKTLEIDENSPVIHLLMGVLHE
jgi:hypothetical protein